MDIIMFSLVKSKQTNEAYHRCDSHRSAVIVIINARGQHQTVFLMHHESINFRPQLTLKDDTHTYNFGEKRIKRHNFCSFQYFLPFVRTKHTEAVVLLGRR